MLLIALLGFVAATMLAGDRLPTWFVPWIALSVLAFVMVRTVLRYHVAIVAVIIATLAALRALRDGLLAGYPGAGLEAALGIGGAIMLGALAYRWMDGWTADQQVQSGRQTGRQGISSALFRVLPLGSGATGKFAPQCAAALPRRHRMALLPKTEAFRRQAVIGSACVALILTVMLSPAQPVLAQVALYWNNPTPRILDPDIAPEGNHLNLNPAVANPSKTSWSAFGAEALRTSINTGETYSGSLYGFGLVAKDSTAGPLTGGLRSRAALAGQYIELKQSEPVGLDKTIYQAGVNAAVEFEEFVSVGYGIRRLSRIDLAANSVTNEVVGGLVFNFISDGSGFAFGLASGTDKITDTDPSTGSLIREGVRGVDIRGMGFKLRTSNSFRMSFEHYQEDRDAYQYLATEFGQQKVVGDVMTVYLGKESKYVLYYSQYKIARELDPDSRFFTYDVKISFDEFVPFFHREDGQRETGDRISTTALGFAYYFK